MKDEHSQARSVGGYIVEPDQVGLLLGQGGPSS